MLNTVVGSAIGGLVAGAVALGAATVMRPSPAPTFAVEPQSAYAMPVANTASMNASLSTAPVLQCQPYEEAVWQRGLVAGRERVALVRRRAVEVDAGVANAAVSYTHLTLPTN